MFYYWMKKRKLKKQQAEATNENLFRLLLPLLIGFKKVVAGHKGADSERMDIFLGELNDFCLHPLRGDVIPSRDWFDGQFKAEFPNIKLMCEAIYPHFYDSLNGNQQHLLATRYSLGHGSTFTCYRLLFLLRRIMLIETYRKEILFDIVTTG